MIRALPPVPTRDDPTNFALKADAFLAALPGFADDANALEQSLQLVATTGTSASTLTVGVGSKSLTTQPGKAWATGAWVYVFAAAAVSNYMVGRVTSYNTTTGALVVNVSAIDGSGSHSSWIIGLGTPAADGHLVARDGSRAMTAELLLVGNAANALGAVPKQQMESFASGAANSAVADRMRVSLTASQATTSGTAIDFTGIPSWAKRLTVVAQDVSTSGGSQILVQIGGSSGVSASGYVGGNLYYLGGSSGAHESLTSGFRIFIGGAGIFRFGVMVLNRLTADKWVATGQVAHAGGFAWVSGVKVLSETLDRLRFTTVNGTDPLTQGEVSLLIEG